MSCKGPSSVFDFLDSEVQPSESDLSKHIEECSDCRGRHQFYSQFRQQIREGHNEIALPELSRARILKALKATANPEPSKAPAPSKRVWGAGLAAAAGFLLFSTLALYQAPTSNSQQLASALASDHLKCCDSSNKQTAYGSATTSVADPVQVAQNTFHKSPDMASFPNLAPIHCQVCAIDQKHQALHVVYRHPSSTQMVSMFGLPVDNQNDFDLPESQDSVEPHVLPNAEHNLVAWRHNGWVYSLVSDMAPNQLAQLAREGRYLARARWAPPGLPTSPTRNPYEGLAQPASFQR